MSETTKEFDNFCKKIFDAKPGGDNQLTDYVEWVIAHKGCGKPLIGMSPKNGWCMCMTMPKLPPSPLPEPTIEEGQKAVALTRLQDEVFGKLSTILKCSPADVKNKLQKWTKQHTEINTLLDWYEKESAKIT